jgi:hypothetical protein
MHFVLSLSDGAFGGGSMAQSAMEIQLMQATDSVWSSVIKKIWKAKLNQLQWSKDNSLCWHVDEQSISSFCH